MRLRDLKIEIERSAKNLFGEKAYPVTSGWIPLSDVLAIVDRFEKEWRREFGTTLSIADSSSHQQLKEDIRRIIGDLLD